MGKRRGLNDKDMKKPNHLRDENIIIKEIQDCQRFEGYRQDELSKELKVIEYIEYLENLLTLNDIIF